MYHTLQRKIGFPENTEADGTEVAHHELEPANVSSSYERRGPR